MPRNGSRRGSSPSTAAFINSPALDVTANDVIAVDGKPLPPASARVVHVSQPRGLMTTHADPEGGPTVFDQSAGKDCRD